MYKNQNIANFILYDIARTKVKDNLTVNRGIISDVVEGWDQNIYIVPNKTIRLRQMQQATKNFHLM